jgi:2-polyprenyl-6-methoxyphenol hydroxylase-like FAD-dependent oxidoreductase
MNKDPEVVVVGAGPSGIIITNELLRRGVNVRWIDARPEPLGTTRAFTVHSRTFELLEHIGIAHKILDVNAFCPGNRFLIKEMDLPVNEMPVLDFRKLENTRYNFYGKVNQQDLETILRNHIECQNNFSPEWGAECKSVKQDDSGIEMQIFNQATGTTETLRPTWVIGADGAHSVVRKGCGLEMAGDAYKDADSGDDGFFTMSMMDVPLEGYEGDDDWVNYHFSADNWMLVTRLPDGNHRVYISGELEKELHETDDHISVFQKGLDIFAPGTRVNKDQKATTWKIYRKIADDYSRGNVFLCGDACHVRSPAGGQGMNCCMMDAFNLGWKLASVINGNSPRSILETYKQERMPVAQLVQGFAERMHNVLFDHTRSIEQRIADTRDKSWHDECIYGISGISHSYRDVNWSPDNFSSIPDGPAAGDRAPNAKLNTTPLLWLHDLFRHTRATLLLLPSNESELESCHQIIRDVENDFSNSVKTVIAYSKQLPGFGIEKLYTSNTGELEQWYGSGDTGRMYLVRPDLFIGCRGLITDVAALKEYLSHWFKVS